MKKETKKDKAAAQPNLFGEQDAAYNTIQEEVTIVQDAIKGCQDAIEKKEDQLTELMARIGKLNRAAETVAKLRDKDLKKKGGEEKDKKENEKATWPKEKNKKTGE